jgi:hypothetical protein
VRCVDADSAAQRHKARRSRHAQSCGPPCPGGSRPARRRDNRCRTRAGFDRETATRARPHGGRVMHSATGAPGPGLFGPMVAGERWSIRSPPRRIQEGHGQLARRQRVWGFMRLGRPGPDRSVEALRSPRRKPRVPASAHRRSPAPHDVALPKPESRDAGRLADAGRRADTWRSRTSSHPALRLSSPRTDKVLPGGPSALSASLVELTAIARVTKTGSPASPDKRASAQQSRPRSLGTRLERLEARA